VKRTRSVRTLAVLAAASLLATTACGDDDDDGGDAAATSDDTGSSAAPSGTDAPADDGDDARDGETIRLWLNANDTPQEVVDWAIAEFNEMHPDVTVRLERQQWTGLVERLTTALSGNDAPDIVEFGNTQAQSFEAAGAVVDLTDRFDELGGEDAFLQSLLEASTYDGRIYAVPYYAGARVVVYRKDLFEAAGLELPTTLEEWIQAGVTLKEANASTPNFSGIYLPARNWHAAVSFIWETGGDIAVKEGDQWVGTLDSPESIAGLELFKRVFDEANAAPADADDSQDFTAFCNGEVGMMPAPGWKPGQIVDPEQGCPEMEPNIGVFAMPGSAPGTTAPVFLGGSVLAIPTRSEHQDLAFDLLKILASAGYQQRMAEAGLIPALRSELDEVTGSEAAEAQAKAAENSRFVPSSEKWTGVEAANVLPDMLTRIAQGTPIEEAAAEADAAIEATLNG